MKIYRKIIAWYSRLKFNPIGKLFLGIIMWLSIEAFEIYGLLIGGILIFIFYTLFIIIKDLKTSDSKVIK